MGRRMHIEGVQHTATPAKGTPVVKKAHANGGGANGHAHGTATHVANGAPHGSGAARAVATTSTDGAPADGEDVFTMPLEKLRVNAKRAREEVAAVLDKYLPGLQVLTNAERKASDGKLRKGEDAALLGVAKAVLARPQLFEAWTKLGHDAAALADRMQRSVILGEVAGSVADEGAPLSDSQLILNGGARAPLLEAYDIAKPNAVHDEVVKQCIVVTVDHYARPARKGARTKRAKKQAAQHADETPKANGAG